MLPLTTTAGAAASAASRNDAALATAQAPNVAPPVALAPPTATLRTAPAVIAPLSTERYKLQVTLSREAKERLLRAQALMRHHNPKGDLALVLERALEVLCEQLEANKFGKCKRARRAASAQFLEHAGASTIDAAATNSSQSTGNPRDAADEQAPEHTSSSLGEPKARDNVQQSATDALSVPAVAAKVCGAGKRTRAIPRAVRRAVAERDEYRCAYVSPDGQRCSSTTMLEYHHRTPFARGGLATVDGCELRCRVHNDLAARLDFGEAHMAACKQRRHDKPGAET